MTTAGEETKRLSDYCRLFIVGGKNTTEDELQTTFGQFGRITNLYIVKQPNSDEHKGIMYVTFEKPSQAALALEEMNGKTLPSNPKPLKIMIASKKKAGSGQTNPHEEECLDRLFLVIPRTATQEDIKSIFEEWGDIEYVRILHDKKSGKSKGVCFVKYYRTYHCAKALEECDPSYKAVFASKKGADTSQSQSQPQKTSTDTGILPMPSYYDNNLRSPYDTTPAAYNASGMGSYGYDMSGYGMGYDYGIDSTMSQQMAPRDQFTESWIPKNMCVNASADLEILASTTVSVDNLRKLFDIVPGLLSCDINRVTGVGHVRYSSVQHAEYARQKLDGFEYPVGFRLSVKVASQGFTSASGSTGGGMSQIAQSLQDAAISVESMQSGDLGSNLQTLLHSIQKAATAVQEMATPGTSAVSHQATNEVMVPVKYCNVPLPQVKPFVSRETSCAKRLFFVCRPDSFPDNVLHDCFCRFGNLIDVYFMPGKNYGYAKFSSEASANRAMVVLNENQVYGMRIKVMEAEDQKKNNGANAVKRQRTSPMDAD